MSAELVAILNGREIGRVLRDRRGRLSFVYAEAWRAARGAYPLSLSMPLAAAEHGHRPVEAFLWGLLPDNEAVLDRWARRFQVSARNPFALLSHVGEDCAGAVQFVRPDRLDALTGEGPPDIEWLDEEAIAERLRALRADHAAWRIPRDIGQFSLAGAQPKTALLYDNGRWGVARHQNWSCPRIDVPRIGRSSSGFPGSAPPPNSGVTRDISYSAFVRPDERVVGGTGQLGMRLGFGIYRFPPSSDRSWSASIRLGESKRYYNYASLTRRKAKRVEIG